jgi:hypothetical protein
MNDNDKIVYEYKEDKHSLKTYGQKITWLSPGKWELSWYQNQLTPGNKQPEPILHKRKTGIKGAKEFCKKHGLEFIKDTHSGRKVETAKERRRRYYLHWKLRRAGFSVDAHKKQIEVGLGAKLIDVNELISKGYNAQLKLLADDGEVIKANLTL